MMNSQNPDLQVQFEEEVNQLLMTIEDIIDAYNSHQDLNQHIPDLVHFFNSVKAIQEQRAIVRSKMYQAILKY